MQATQVDVLIIGAGISGIGAAYHLQKHCPDKSYAIIEARAAVGGTWCFHFTFTAWMISKNQPDLRQHGTFFSLVVICLCNLLILSVFLIVISGEITLRGFALSWVENASSLLHWVTGRGRP